MGLDISAAAKQKQQEYTKQSLAHGVLELMKKSEHKFVMINKKSWKATRKVIKSQIGITPLKKQETREKKKGGKEFYCLAFQGMQDLNVTINSKSINYFFEKQNENISGVDSICCERFSSQQRTLF